MSLLSKIALAQLVMQVNLPNSVLILHGSNNQDLIAESLLELNLHFLKVLKYKRVCLYQDLK